MSDILKIAVYTLRPEEEECGALIALLGEQLGSAEILVSGFEDVFYGRVPGDLRAAFVIVDNMRALECARKLSRNNIPLALVSGSPDYAMEGIRLDVRHYIIRPVGRDDVKTALTRLGLDMQEGSCADEGPDP